MKTRENENGQIQIWCPSRQMWVALTPEERVRQAIVEYLNLKLGYPMGRIGVEQLVRVNGLPQRADIIIYDQTGGALMVVECKATHVEIDHKVLNQALRYNGTLGAKYIVLSNGRQTFCAVNENGVYKPLKSIPAYGAL